MSAAFAVNILTLTEAVSIARSIATKSGQRIDGNQEFIGQGLSNILGGFFSGYASSGSFNRSGVNFEAGAQTPLAAVFSAFFLLLILFLVAPLAAHLPIPAMAAVLFLVIQAMSKLKKQEEAKPKPPEVPADVKLLTEIRDLLAMRK